MKLWHAAFSALLFFIPSAAASDDGNGAARELARRTAAFVGKGEPVSVSWNNVSSLGSAELLQIRNTFEAALREAGGRISDVVPSTDTRIMLSENRTQFLLVEEIRRGEERQVWISSWKRTDSTLHSSGILLDKKLVWEQEEPMLDVAFPAGTMVVLSPTRVTLYTRAETAWKVASSVPVSPAKPWPRDLRGRMRVNAANFQTYLPGMACSGGVDPSFTFECKPTEEPWVLESGSRALLLSYFTTSRNFFDGRVIMQTGARKTVPPFYSAAFAQEQGQLFWLLAMVDGRTQMFDSLFEPVGTIASWGSDIVGTDAHCGAGSQVLATRPGDGTAGDAIQAFSIVNRSAAPVTPPLEMPGPVTALWPSGTWSVLAIVRNPATGKYEAYVVTVACS